MKQPHTTARLLSNRKHVRLAHRLSWRARIKIPVLKGKKHLADKITARLLEMPAATAAIIRMPTGSLILEHCNGPVNLDEVMQLIEKQLLLYQSNEAKAHEISGNTCRQSKDVEKTHVSGPVLLISGIYLLYLWIRRFFGPAKPAVLLSQVSRILGLPALNAIFLSLQILKKGLKSLARTGKPGMDLIITGIVNSVFRNTFIHWQPYSGHSHADHHLSMRHPALSGYSIDSINGQCRQTRHSH